jgi:hypothetical protein
MPSNPATGQRRAPRLVTERLQPEQIRTLYPLMRASQPALLLPDWLRYARRVTAARAQSREGVLVVRRPALRHPSGAVCYRRDRGMGPASTLTAEHFIALDLLEPAAVLAALAEGLDGVAERLGCNTILSIVHGDPSLVENLRSAGHAPDGVVLRRNVAVGKHVVF